MHLGAAAASFVVVFPAELPDKTLVATLVMGTRHRPLAVWAGAAAAFAVHVALAVSAGSLLALLPGRLVHGLVAAAFLAGAAVLLLGKEEAEEHAGEALAERVAPSARRVAASAFVVILVAEFGDISQVLTANLAARYHDAVGVAVGSLAALWLAAGVALVAGRSLVRVVPLALVRRVAGALLLVFAGLSVAALVGH
jgi:putative Ca2+/H+ antiporter (TMEM165/GDT1 family)